MTARASRDSAAPAQALRRESSIPPVAGTGRIIKYTFSDGSVDRVGDTIDPYGWDLANFRKSPVFLWAHDSSSPPIGRVVDVRVEGEALVGTVEFADAETYEFADTIFKLTKAGYLNACSVGFLPIECEYANDPERPFGIDYRRQELLEVSAVPVPALPSALVSARAAGIDTAPLVDWMARHDLPPSRDRPHIRKAATMLPLNRKSRPAGVAARPGGFKSLGENLIAIIKASQPGGPVDQRLVRAPLGLGETDPSGGGFAVAEQFATELVWGAYEEAVIAPLCDRRETSAPLSAVKIPGIDETSRADGSRWGGALAYWAAEGATVAPTLPRFKQLELSPKKLIAICYGTDEVMSDAPMFEAHVRRVFAAEMAFKLDGAILAGSGAGVPQGMLASSALITVPALNGQAPATIVGENISQMWQRLPGPSRRRAVWLVHEDVEHQLDGLTSTETPAGFFLPAGVNGNEYPMLKGRPVLAVEQCAPVGSVGDIVLADLSKYIIVDGGVRMALSADALFVTDQVILRFTLRIDGQPAFTSPITPYRGTDTRSPYVTLAAR